jgi:hypothetical protein
MTASTKSLPFITPRDAALTTLVLLAVTAVTWVLSAFVVDREMAARLSDNSWYIQMAGGDYSVPKPFNTRIVLPWLAGHLSGVSGWSLGGAFLCLQHLALLLLHAFAALSMRRLFGIGLLRSTWVTGLCILTQGFAWLVGATYYPDLLFLAWTSICIWAWLGSRWWLVALSLFLALITRDSSALPLALVIVIGAWKSKEKLGMAAPAVAVICQQLFFKFIYVTGATNVHGLGELLYLPLKLVMNASRSYFGLRLWSNTLSENPITAPSNPMPETTWDLPAWLHLGGIRRVGFYPWSFNLIVETFVQMLATFGLPLAVACVLARRFMHKEQREALLAATGFPGMLILLYGLLMLLLGPATGTDLPRLIMAAWPCAVLLGAGAMAATLQPVRVAVLLSLSAGIGWVLHFAWRENANALLLKPHALLGLLLLAVFALLACSRLAKEPVSTLQGASD